jgi:anti-anti-sigma factor
MSLLPQFAIDRVVASSGPVMLHLRGALDYGHAQRLRAVLEEYELRPVAIDLRGLALLDSTGLAVLLEAARRGVRVRGAAGPVLRLLERTRTLEILGGYE